MTVPAQRRRLKRIISESKYATPFQPSAPCGTLMGCCLFLPHVSPIFAPSRAFPSRPTTGSISTSCPRQGMTSRYPPKRLKKRVLKVNTLRGIPHNARVRLAGEFSTRSQSFRKPFTPAKIPITRRVTFGYCGPQLKKSTSSSYHPIMRYLLRALCIKYKRKSCRLAKHLCSGCLAHS